MSAPVSIVVASHRPDFIRPCIEHILAACRAVSGSEVIAVIDYEPGALCRQYPAVRWIHHPHRGIPQKRNVGIRQCAGSVVGFTDDDCRPHPEWIASAMRYLARHPGLAGVEGRTIVDGDCRGSAYRQASRLQRRGRRTNNIFYRAQDLLQAGLFDERFSFQHEDADLAFRIEAPGREIGYCPECVVYHGVRKGEPWDLLKNCWNRRFDPLLYSKHPVRYRAEVGSPFTPTVSAMLVVHLTAVTLWGIGGRSLIVPALTIDLGAALVLGTRRSGWGRHLIRQVWYEWISYLAAPLVLLAALIFGSIRYKKALFA